uniref:Uncharacterized protein n=1 Tax=Knipowitschia caucasica TaxID=637954 RepID=A0AAV2KRZ1_KNICA
MLFLGRGLALKTGTCKAEQTAPDGNGIVRIKQESSSGHYLGDATLIKLRGVWRYALQRRWLDPAASFIALLRGDLSLPTASATPEGTMSLPSSTAGQDSRNLQSSRQRHGVSAKPWSAPDPTHWSP